MRTEFWGTLQIELNPDDIKKSEIKRDGEIVGDIWLELAEQFDIYLILEGLVNKGIKEVELDVLGKIKVTLENGIQYPCQDKEAINILRFLDNLLKSKFRIAYEKSGLKGEEIFKLLKILYFNNISPVLVKWPWDDFNNDRVCFFD